MLKLRPATVVETLHAREDLESPEHRRSHGGAGEQRLVVELAGGDSSGAGGEANGTRREAIADIALVGRAEVGDEVIVNTQALDLGLGSGGFDVVHVNLTRGLHDAGDGLADGPDVGRGAPARTDARVMKLNYTSLQHEVSAVEDARLELPVGRPTAVLALHGQLAALAWAFAQSAPGRRLGYVQTQGGALSGAHSRTVRALRERGLLAGHVTVGACFGGEGEAVSVAGAIHHGLRELGWDAAVCGPGPGIVGSGTPLGHGGMSALDSAHAALSLGSATLLVARMSSGDERSRHRGISHHSLTVLDLLLEPVTVALPAGVRSPVGADLRAGLQSVFGGAMPSAPGGPRAALAVEVERPARIARHDWRRAKIDLPAFAASGLPAQTMGRGLASDPLFFGSALAGGGVLAELVAQAASEEAG